MEKLYLIDASGWIYRSYFAIRNMTNAKGESTNALFGFIRSLLKLFKDFHPDHLAAVFDGPNSIQARKAVYEHYKAHRAEMPGDLRYQIGWAQEWCDLMGIPKLVVPDVEADDAMGSVALWAAKKGYVVYLCTSDKDMAQMVTDKILLLNTHKENQVLDPHGVEETYGVPPNQIIDLLAIVGDASDNVPGLDGFGPKTAVALLKEFHSLDNLLKHPEKFSGKKQQVLVDQANEARLSRQLVTLDTNVDFPKEASFFKLKPPEVSQLKEFYGTMHFHSLIREFEQALPEAQKQGAGQEEYTLVDDEASFQALLKTLNHHKEIGFDTETTSLKPLEAELVGIGFGVEPEKAWYVPLNGALGKAKVLEGLKTLFENPKIGFYGHNVKYDLHILENYGIKVPHVCFDTIVASYVLNSHSRQHNLDSLALEYFGKVKIPITDLIGKGKKQISMRDVPLEKVSTYCCEDVDYTVRLKQLFEKLLKERKLQHVFEEIELPLVPVLVQMERHGIFVDVAHLQEMGKGIISKIRQLEEHIYQLAGTAFNINSPKQLSDILFNKLGIKAPKKTATGLSTNADVLESLQNDYPIAGKLIEYRTLEKLRSTYIEILPQEVNHKTHRIHCTFNQFVAATGRLSCQDPNLQNIPVRTEEGRMIREAFRPEKRGWSYLAADYSQIELRLLAHLSHDPTLIKAFENNEDIHAYTASLIFNVPLKEITKELRFHAKAVNFGIIYGQGPYGLSQELGIEVKEASHFIEMYFKRYGRVREFIESCKEKARQSGKSVTITGRERAIPEITSKNGMLRSAAERLAINTPLQGTAADLIKLAMLKIDQKLNKGRHLGYMILQIHDELIFEVPDFEIVALEPLIKETMEKVFHLKVPLVVDITIGKNWKEC